MSVHGAPLWLVVVARDRRDLLARLGRSFAGTPMIDLVLDRRQGERRRQDTPGPGDRRRGDRRRPATLARSSPAGGYRLIQRAEGFDVFQAEARASARCPECAALIEFEMPRFGELPARLDLLVVHTERTPHAVETQAFRASGRPFLACRMLARRCADGGSPREASALPVC